MNYDTIITCMQQQNEKLLQLFGQHIKKLRMQKKMSLNEFAFKSLLLTSATQSRIENGLVDLKFSTLVKIANALNITPSELLEGFDFKF